MNDKELIRKILEKIDSVDIEISITNLNIEGYNVFEVANYCKELIDLEMIKYSGEDFDIVIEGLTDIGQNKLNNLNEYNEKYKNSIFRYIQLKRLDISKKEMVWSYGIEDIKNKGFYLTPLKDLNDIFEGSFDIRYDIDFDIVNKKRLYELKQDYIVLSRNTKGVKSFAKRHDNVLMWSHYSNNSNGICIEFDITKKPFSDLKPIKYINQKTIDLQGLTSEEEIKQHMGDIILKNFLYEKSKEWEYEQEYRMLGDIPKKIEDNKVPFELESIKAIYFYNPDLNTNAYCQNVVDESVDKMMELINYFSEIKEVDFYISYIEDNEIKFKLMYRKLKNADAMHFFPNKNSSYFAYFMAKNITQNLYKYKK